MRYMALACLLSTTTACQWFGTPEDRINAAVPLSERATQAKQAFDAAARAQSFDAGRIDNEFHDRLKMRALECAHGYSPSLLQGEAHIRDQLSDTGCFEKFDRSLAQWIGLRHAGLLLAAPPLRPIPTQKIAPYLVASERISEASFARQAGIAVLHTAGQHEVFDLGSGERLRQIAREGRSFVVDISDNGRLLSLNQDQATVVLDLEQGKPLLRLDNVRDQRLFWVGQAGALYVPDDERAPLFLDLLNDRQSPIPTSLDRIGAVAPTPVPGRYALLGFTRHAAIDLAQDAQGWKATLALEAEPGQAVGHWSRGQLTADGSAYVGQQNGPVLIDLRTLELRKPGLAPLMVGMTVPTPDPDTLYLFGHYRSANDIEYQALLYSWRKHTLAPAQVGKRLSSTLTWIPSVRRLALRDDFKLTLLDALPASQAPIDADDYLRQLPVVETEPSPAAGEEADAALAAWRAAVAAQASPARATDSGLAALAANALIETVGVYEGEGAVHGAGSSVRTPGTVQVMVRRGRPVILVLTSYEPVNWIVKPEPGAKVLAVLHGGYHPSQVHGAGEARTIDLGRIYAYKRSDAGFGRLDAEVRQRSGKGIDRFQGSYRGNVFRVGVD
ncbi:hypothetical protein [Pseudoxanthomonas yeongjuensis]|uniref:hypothetical protein n=1 Tax=Pseudoxanthomonas yeongjuensis TaxID=377616 RepID=UPI001391E14A|nr:hypothetical protein [Pseudoxanthomonas yeongjuensis]